MLGAERALACAPRLCVRSMEGLGIFIATERSTTTVSVYDPTVEWASSCDTGAIVE